MRIIWLLALLVFSCFSSQNEDTQSENAIGADAGQSPESPNKNIATKAPEEAAHPLSIRGMRARVAKAAKVTKASGAEQGLASGFASGFALQQKLPDTKAYSSSVVSFEANGIKQYAEISRPVASVQAQPAAGYPVILLLHGYIPPSSYSTTRSYSILFRRYAPSEFVVIKPDYQGHGQSERQANFEQTLSTVFYTEDVLQLLAALKSLDYVDLDKVFVMGHSMGGEIALRLAVVYPHIQAISLWAPVTAAREEVNFYYGGGRQFGNNALALPKSAPLIKAEQKKVQQALKRLGMKGLSDIRYLDELATIQTPLQIQHPDTDESVPYIWSLQFQKRYEALPNSPSLKLINYPGDNHNIAKNQRRAQNLDLEWFRSFL